MTFDPTSATPAPEFDPTTATPDSGPPVRAVLHDAVRTKPDDLAEAERLRKRYPAPVDTLYRNLADVKLQEAVDVADERLKTSPKLAQHMRDNPFAARLAHDDIEPLAELEQFTRDIGGAIKAGVFRTSRGAAGTFQAGLEFAATGLELNPLIQAWEDSGRLGGNPLRRLAEGFAMQGAAAGETAKAARPKSEGVLMGGFFSGIESLTSNLLALPMAFLPGGQGAAMTMMTAGTGGDAYQTAREKGLSMQQALPFAVSQGAIEYATEKLPLGALLKDVKAGTPFFETLARQIALEIPGEQIATVLQDLNEWAILNPEKPFSGYLEDRPSAAAQTLVATIVGAGGNVAVMKGLEAVIERGARDGANMQRAGITAQALEQAMKAAAGSALRERSPEQFRQVMTAMAEDGSVYLDAEVLNQLPADLLQQMEGVADELPAALAAGGSVAVKLADALTLLPGTTHADTFMQNARISPDAPSALEAEAAGKKAGEFLQQEAARVIAEATNQDEMRASAEVVRTTLLEQINASGRYRPAVAEGMSQWASAFYTTMASRMGVTPEQFYQAHPLRILGAPTGQGAVLNEGARPGTLDIDGYHFSTAARPTLSTAFYGTGLKGSAREEIQNYPDKRVGQRLSFYFDKGTGIRPESGVGGIAHRARLTNVYDADTDLLGLRTGDARAFETAVLDAGFSGYANRMDGTQPGQVIMLGPQTITPEVLGPRSKIEGGERPPALQVSEAPWRTEASGAPEQLQARLAKMQASPAWGDYDLRIEGGELQARKKGGVFEQSVSTRLPTAKKALENPLEAMLIIGLDAAKADPKAFEKNVELLRAYPNFRDNKSASTPDKAVEQFIKHVVDNLLWLHDAVPTETRERSKLWYDGARAIVDRWTEKYGITDAQAAGMLAVLSPQKDWFQNVSLAERVLDVMLTKQEFVWSDEMSATAAGIGALNPEDVGEITGKTLGELDSDYLQAMWARVYDQTYHERGYRVVTPEGDFGGWITNADGETRSKTAWGSFNEIGKAVSIFKDGSIANISASLGEQHKVRNFYNNIFNPASALGDVTIDTHAVAAALLRPLSGSATEVLHNFGAGGAASSSVFGSKGTYGIYAEAYRRAAAERGILAREMQSITWEAVRGLYTAGFKAQAANVASVDAVWEQYKKRRISLDEARKQLLELAGGVAAPEWERPGAGAPEAAWASSYTGELREGGGADGATGSGAGGLLAQSATGDLNDRLEQTGDGAGRYSSGGLAPLAGAPTVAGASGPDARLVAVAEQYAASVGIDLRRQPAYVQVDPERGARIAAAYEAMAHAPNDPVVREAYDNLARQTMAQYQALQQAGYQFWFMDPAADPYAGNPWNAMRDLRANQSMAVFPSEAGFGSSEADVSGNPLLADTGLTWAYGTPDGEQRPVLFNDLFRAVHDAFGHGLEGAGFRAQGEENAWQAHRAMFTGSAVGAITSETRGQNSWLNFGPHGEKNQTAKVEDTVFADQKTGLMPEWTWNEGVAGEQVLEQGPRGTFNPKTLELVLNPNANLSTFFHETGHFFLEVMADIASQPNAPAQIVEDMGTFLKWAGIKDLATWNALDLDGKRASHERWAESIEQYVMEGKAPSPELAPLMRRFAAWVKDAYKNLIAPWVREKDNPVQLNDDIRRVMDRMLATDEQIAQANEVAGLVPDETADGEAAERLRKRSMADLKWAVKARDQVIGKLRKQAAAIEKEIREAVTVEVDQTPEMRAKRALDALSISPEYAGQIAEHKATRKAAEAAARDEVKAALLSSNPDAKGLVKGQLLAKNKRDIDNKVDAAMIKWDAANPAPKRPVNATDADVATVADSFGFETVDAMMQAIDAYGPRAAAIDGITEQRMLEEHGDLIDERAIAEAANEAVHNEARARSLATELRTQGEMLNTRTDTGETNAKGSKITVNALVEAAKQFGANVVARTPLRDLKAKAWQHTAAEKRAGKRWQEATAAGKTADAVKAKQDQVLNNAAAKAAIDAREEARKIVEFFKRVTKGNDETVVEKGRDADIVNAARAVLAAYGVGSPASKGAQDYLDLVAKNDPETYNVIQPMVAGAMQNAQPLDALTFEELQSLHEEIQALWFLAKRSRQFEVGGDLMDVEDAASEIYDRLEEIGIPDTVPGETGALTPREERARQWLQQVPALLRRVEQWAEAKDGKFGGPFLRYVFQPVKEAADRYRTDRLAYRKKFQALVDNIAPRMTPGLIAAPELGYTFGRGHNGIGHAELLHAILHTGNESNKRKLLLGRGWATENADGTLDTARWDAFTQRLASEGTLTPAHYDFAQGVWNLMEETKPLAQKTHRAVFGRYFAEVTADSFVDPWGQARSGGYVPAQADPALVQDADLRELLETENAGMAQAFPSTNRGFTKSRVEYNRPLKLDLRTLAQHIDKVLLFSHMEPAVRGAAKLLRQKNVSQPLARVDPGAMGGMLKPWLNRSARQTVETPISADAGLNRIASTVRGRVGMALMFANVSNTLQQITGFSTAALRVKPALMMRATAQFVRNPKRSREAVWALSPYMADRASNEVAVLSDTMEQILINPSVYRKGEMWTRRHGYFLQTAMDNVMSPIIWSAAYNQAVAEKMSDADAVRFADGTIRQTQGSTLPEDVSRFETGPAYARLFTQFVGYFNMLANTNATALKQIADEQGLKKGAGKAFGVLMLGLLVPIWVAEAIANGMRGGPDDEDDDGYLDDWLAAVFGFGTIRGLLAQVPIIGQAAQSVVNRFNAQPADDKFSLSPTVSVLESAAGSPASVYKAIVDDGSKQKAVRDVSALITVMTGLPAMAVARPVGYLTGVADDRIDPTGAADAVRGVITGTASPASKQ